MTSTTHRTASARIAVKRPAARLALSLTLLGAVGLASGVAAQEVSAIDAEATAQIPPPASAGLDMPAYLPSTADPVITGPALAPNARIVGDAPIADGTVLSSTPLETSRAPAAPITAPPVRYADPGAGPAATVLADRITLSGNRDLHAEGGVVVWYQGARLVASAVRFDGDTGALAIDGPIHLTPAQSTDSADSLTSESILLADQAELDPNLRDGILRGARLILARELQLAAREATVSGEGRWTTLSHVVASSCRICAGDEHPLWEIRARAIRHDRETRQLAFERPQFRAFGLPIASIPATVRAPDPTVERMSGFLRPRIRTTSGLGFGVKLPYFLTLGDHADLTVTPYLAASRTATLELRYRQAFRNGSMEWNGAITRDDIKPDDIRGYLFGAARFDLGNDYRLGVQLQTTSDRGYLLDYDISDADRLWSGVTLDRVRPRSLMQARIGNYHSLRDGEDNATSPAQVADFRWQRRFSPNWIGGEARLEWSAHAHRRPSGQDQIGRDMARGSARLDWRRNDVLPGGVLFGALAGVEADLYHIRDDSRYPSSQTRVQPYAGVELRWPLTGSDEAAQYILEPVAQILWSGDDIGDLPNEDSRLIEFDRGNLFALSRFPGHDARETGLRANLGVSWTRIDPTGWSLGLTAGRVLRRGRDALPGADGPINGRRSDWLLEANYAHPNGLSLANRALLDNDFKVRRDELRLGWLRPGLQLSLGYLWQQDDPSEGRNQDLSELTANAGWQFRDGWWISTETRYDFTADRAQKIKLGLRYRNECISVDLSASRRFTSSNSVRPETDFGLSVRLGGFGRDADSTGTVARRACIR